ncbi:hypothetical protein BOQ62_10655 [Chryseobacterium sp. CH21]|uniref:hypothetical protein n=1 Tax=Chryseobacterium sp. CH21 TaxID=713556 RepID=UPI00100BA55A|nr:hypothetical protein [Chryseobacterium sp. CH21]RXM39624.1 hypothetical protein BOQ62_10655 [Chryseobacterium sp. CH21]
MFSIIQNVKNRNIIGQINSVAGFVEHLKDAKRVEVSQILKLREIDKKSKEYQAIKIILPSICFNYTFKNNYVNSENADESTGFLYFDIDGEKDFNYDTTYITALWKSVGGNGFGLLVKVRNLVKENFKESYEHIVDILGIPYDKSCNDCSRVNIISFDTEAHYNENAVEIDLSEFNTTIIHAVKKLPHFNSNKNKNLGYSLNGGNIRFNNLSDILEEKDFEFNKDGYYDFGKEKVEYCKCFVPRKIVPEGLRNQRVSSYAYCLISINPDARFTNFKRYLQKYNSKSCNPPLEWEEIDEIATKIYNQRGNVEPRNNAKRRVIYSDEIKTLSEKQKINGRVLGNDRSEKTVKELIDCVMNWDYEKHPKITQKSLIEVSDKNKKTVEKYYRNVLNTAKRLKADSLKNKVGE